MKRITGLSVVLLSLSCGVSTVQSAQILVGDGATAIEQYAARELQRYLYQLTGTLAAVRPAGSTVDEATFLVGRAQTHADIQKLASEGSIVVRAGDPGAQGYVLKTVSMAGRAVLVIAGADEVGTLYGVYGLLEDHYGVAFHLGGDVLPQRQTALRIGELDERKTPAVSVRGFLPWTNFPQSATVYSWEDWKFIIDQTARMRMNFLHIHNYNGQCDHNEMFHNFTYRGQLSRVWMATARSGHKWACPGWDVNEYLFGASDLFDDYDFGADCALHNESLSNEEVFRKGVSLFQRVIDYAHSRGVKIGLGLDVNLIPREYPAKAEAPEVIEARVRQVAEDYPELDYLLCFQSEGGGHGDDSFFEKWRAITMAFYEGMKARAPRTRLGVAGWGLNPASIATLPPDIIAAPISAYSDKCESGAIYGEREYWGCPWLERDFRSSEYYYPYGMHLSNTIEAWKSRSANMKGFYCLTWRLTDAIDPKMSFVAKAPWDAAGKYSSSRAVYHEYAVRHYGRQAADEITAIINENEPFAGDFGECQATPVLSSSLRLNSGALLNISRFAVHAGAGVPRMSAAASPTNQQGTQNAPCTEGGQCVGWIDNGDWLRYENVDFGNAATVFEARVASAETGGEIEARLDGPEGRLLGTCAVPVTGGWQNWQTVKTDIAPTSGRQTLFLRFWGLKIDDRKKAVEQLAIVDKWITRARSSGERERLTLLRCRLAAAKAYIELDLQFPSATWERLPGDFPEWVRNFTHRVTDISSLGNVQSTQNRFVQLHYVGREKELRAMQAVKAPSHVTARGTLKGAVISWKNEEPDARGFVVCRDGRRLTSAALPSNCTSFEDAGDGIGGYTVVAIGKDGQESPPGVPTICAAGVSDKDAPHIVVISPPGSVARGQVLEVKVRLLDSREYGLLSARLFFRTLGRQKWREVPAQRRTKGIFTAAVPADAVGPDGVEYYVEASDGSNRAFFPADGPERPLSATLYDAPSGVRPPEPPELRVVDRTLTWTPAADGAAFWYRIYRHPEASRAGCPEGRLAYVAAGTTRFTDNGLGFDGSRLAGTHTYVVTSVDRTGNESRPSRSVTIQWSAAPTWVGQ